MNTSPGQTPPDAPGPQPVPPKIAVKRPFLPGGCFRWLFAGFVLFVLADVLIPQGPSVNVRGTQTKSLAQAKQIGLALLLYAEDHDGIFPRQGNPVEMKEAPPNANVAFACLFPTYLTAERIFDIKLSSYRSPKGPDDVIDNPYTGHPVQTLRPGENVYGYVMGLTKDSPPTAPLIVDAGTGRYNRAAHRRGGAWWEQGKALVIYADDHGTFATLRGPANTLYLPRTDDPSQNALEADYLGNEVRYLEPAIFKP